MYYFLGPFAARDDLLHVLYNTCNPNVPEVVVDVTTTSTQADGKVYSGRQKPAGKCILTGNGTTINPESELSVTKNDGLAYVNPEFITQGKPEDENYFLGYRIMDRGEFNDSRPTPRRAAIRPAPSPPKLAKKTFIIIGKIML